MKKNTEKLMDMVSKATARLDLDNPSIRIEPSDGLAIIVGSKDGIRYTTTLSVRDEGSIGRLKKNKEHLTDQIHDMNKLGMSQREISEALGVSQPTVSKYLNNK